GCPRPSPVQRAPPLNIRYIATADSHPVRHGCCRARRGVPVRRIQGAVSAGAGPARAGATAVPGRKRLLLLCTGTQVGGMEQVVLELARGLTARAWEVRTVFPAGRHAALIGPWAADQGVAVEFDSRLLHLGQRRSWRDVLA